MGFSQKTCLPASMAALRWVGPESRRCGQQHHIHAAVDDLLVGVQPHKAFVRRHLDLLGMACAGPAGSSATDPRRHRPWRSAPRCCRRSGPGWRRRTRARRSRSSPTRSGAVVFRAKKSAGQNGRRRQRAADEGGGFEEIAASGEVVGWRIHSEMQFGAILSAGTVAM